MLAREWPLAVFTVLAQAAVGLFLALVLPMALSARVSEGGAGPALARALLVVLALLAAGGAFSFFHLGNPRNAPRTLANLKTSWLSREILFEIVFAGLLSLLIALEGASLGPRSVRTGVYALGGLAGVALILSMANIYRLKTVPSWNRPVTPVSFFLTALAVGSVGALIAVETGLFGISGAFFPFPVVLKASAVGFLCLSFATAFLFDSVYGLLRTRRIPVEARTSAARLGFFVLRLGLLGFAVAAVAAIGTPPALAAVLISEGLGRALFYASFRKAGL